MENTEQAPLPDSNDYGVMRGGRGVQNSDTIMHLCDVPTTTTACVAALPFDVVLTGGRLMTQPTVDGRYLRPNFCLPLTENVTGYLLRTALRTAYLVTLSPALETPLSLCSTTSLSQ
jgi:hypothetical protein